MTDLNFLAAMAIIILGFGGVGIVAYWMTRGDEAAAKAERLHQKHP